MLTFIFFPLIAQTAITPGFYTGFQFGYLSTDYATDLELYTPGQLQTTPQGSYFIFRPEFGYNFTSLLGVEVGVQSFSDESTSSKYESIYQYANIELTNIDVLALIHLKLTDDGTWMGTPKVGLSYMSATMNYQFFGPSGTSAPWTNNNNAASGSTSMNVLMPTIGVEFEHSYNAHWVMTFAYQYYYGKYTHFNDPYLTPVSTLSYFSTGVLYKF
jgi:hypothetical protein